MPVLRFEPTTFRPRFPFALEQFLLYRYQKISEDFGDGSGGDAHGNGGMDMVAKFAYENSLRQCSIHI